MQDVDKLLTLASDLLRVTRDPEIADYATLTRGFGDLAELYPNNELYRTQRDIARGRLCWCMHERGLLQLTLPDAESTQDLHVPAERLVRCLDRPSGFTAAEAAHLDACDSCMQLVLTFARATAEDPEQAPTSLTFQQAKVRSIVLSTKSIRSNALPG